MKIEISVPQAVSVCKEIWIWPEKVFEMIRLDEREMVGKYLVEIINAELTNYLERKPYKRKEEQTNYRKGHSKGGAPSYFVRDGELMNVKM